MLDKKRYNRQEKTKEDKHQYVFSNGVLVQNVSKLVVVEASKIDFNKKVTCPFCLTWATVSKFVISTKKGYHQGLGLCPECNQQSQLRTLFGLGKLTPKDYAQFVTDYPKGAFWKKCKFEEWKKRLALMNWAEDFWNAYRLLNPKTEEETKEEKEHWNDYFNEPEHPESVPTIKLKPNFIRTRKGEIHSKAFLEDQKKRYALQFKAPECNGCSYRGGKNVSPSFYCLRQCPFNTWTDRTEKW